MLERELNRIVDGIVDSSKNLDIDATMAYIEELENIVGKETAEKIFDRIRDMLNLL